VTFNISGGTLGSGANWAVFAGGTRLATQPAISNNTFTISNITAATSYSVQAEKGFCDNGKASNAVQIGINQPSTAPTLAAANNVTGICSGGNVTFTITGGTLGAGANWAIYANGTRLSTQPAISNNSFTISNITAASSYSVQAEKGSCDNGKASNAVQIGINQPSTTPTLAAANNATNVCSGGSLTFKITGGTLGAGANWAVYVGGTRLSTQPAISNNSFTISNITAATSYSVQAEKGSCDNGKASNSVSISIIAKPTISIQPQSITVEYNSQAQFSVIATGSSPLTYQWYLGNMLVGTGNSYTIPYAQGTNTGTYTCKITDNCGNQIASNPATLKMQCLIHYVDPNGAIGTASQMPNDTVVDYNTKATISNITSELIKSDGPHMWEFGGWSTDPNAITPTYNPGDSRVITTSLELYVVWSLMF
jgi:hypothetical protein